MDLSKNSFSLLEEEEADEVTNLNKIDAPLPTINHETKGKKTSQEVTGYVSKSEWSGEQRKLTKEDKQNKKEREEFMEKKVEPPCSNMEGNLPCVGEKKEFFEFGDTDVGVWDNGAAPMIDVCSVTIYSNNRKACEIYGKIYNNGVEGNSALLYKREQRDAETVYSGGNLLLNCLSGGVMASPIMFIELKDKARNDAWFAKGRLVLDTETEDSNAEVKSATYIGKLGKVSVDYIVIPCAAVAEVEFELIEADFSGTSKEIGSGVGNDFHANVRGTVVASYGKTYGSKISLRRTLFSQLDRPQGVTLGTPIKLSRSMLCVPVNSSSLVIEVNLRINNGENEIAIDHSEELLTESAGTIKRCFSRENVCIQVSVCWHHPYCIFSRQKFKIAKPHFDNQLSSASSICRNPSLRILRYSHSGVQVFSVFICHDRNQVLRLRGTIRASHNRGSSYFFVKGQNCPEILGPHSCNTVSLKGRLNFDIGSFCMYLDLNDVEEHVIIKGYLSLGNAMYTLDSRMHDKPLCSIIRGENAYAAVHYIGFSRALEATVNIFVVFKDDSIPVRANVHGRIIARYGNYKFASLYEAKCYECVLFETRENDKEVLTGDSQARLSIPLSTSKILVPLSETLIIEVDLHVCFQANDVCKDEHLTGRVTFAIICDGKSEKIDDPDVQIGFSLEWGYCCW